MKTGKVTDSVLTRSVLRKLKTKREEVVNGAGIGEDCAIFALKEGKMASCMQQSFLSDPIDLEILIQKCANNLVVSGAEPVAIQLSLTLPEQTEEKQLQELMDRAEDTCKALSMQIAGGHTTVSSKAGAMMAVVCGYGKPAADEGDLFPTRGARPGEDIVITKWIGLEGTARLARLCKDKLAERLPAYMVEEGASFLKYLSVVPEAAVAAKSGVRVMHDVSEGGIFAALWELAEASKVGLNIDLKKLPIRQETVEICELCEVNPYELSGGGALIMTCADGEGLIKELQKAGIPAVIAGKITDGKERLILNEEEKRFMDRPAVDEIYKYL